MSGVVPGSGPILAVSLALDLILDLVLGLVRGLAPGPGCGPDSGPCSLCGLGLGSWLGAGSGSGLAFWLVSGAWFRVSFLFWFRLEVRGLIPGGKKNAEASRGGPGTQTDFLHLGLHTF